MEKHKTVNITEEWKNGIQEKRAIHIKTKTILR